jgi:hypothetical protein
MPKNAIMIWLLLLGILLSPTSVAAILPSADQNLTDQLIVTTTLAGQSMEYQLFSNEQLADHLHDNHLFLANRSAENQLFLSNNSADKSQDYQLIEESKFLEQLRGLNILLEAYLIDKVNQLLIQPTVSL